METLGTTADWRRRKELNAGEAWFKSLSPNDRWALGDDLVLGAFDWRDWFEEPPSKMFMRGVERARLYFAEMAE